MHDPNSATVWTLTRPRNLSKFTATCIMMLMSLNDSSRVDEQEEDSSATPTRLRIYPVYVHVV